jgi:hypothetical protein
MTNDLIIIIIIIIIIILETAHENVLLLSGMTDTLTISWTEEFCQGLCGLDSFVQPLPQATGRRYQPASGEHEGLFTN